MVFCAGLTIPTDPHNVRDRATLAEANAPVFYEYAEAIAKHGHGGQIIIIVSNPVELAVHIFARFIEARRVIGMGAFLDTIRFRCWFLRVLSERSGRTASLVPSSLR